MPPVVGRGQALVSPSAESARWNSKILNHKHVSIVLEENIFKGFGMQYGRTMLWFLRCHVNCTQSRVIGVLGVSVGFLM